jgi:hypothetical protein
MLAARLASRGRCLAARQTRALATGTYRVAGGNVPAQDPNVDRNLGRTPERTAELERLAEEHNGFLFGEVPLPEGQSRQWEDWEWIYYPLMTSATLIYAVAFFYRCVPDIFLPAGRLLYLLLCAPQRGLLLLLQESAWRGACRARKRERESVPASQPRLSFTPPALGLHD